MTQTPTNTVAWRPIGSIERLKQRSKLIQKIRNFFDQRGVWEVETPLLGNSTATDPHIHSLTVLTSPKNRGAQAYLQTSPEFPMKRLLAAGSGSIYQITKAFRAEEQGRLHHTEFTMLEWYRLGFDHHQLMDEMDELLSEILNTPAAQRFTYTQIFQMHLGIDPLQCDLQTLKKCAHEHHLVISDNLTATANNLDFWRQLLMSHLIEPQLGKDRPAFILDFPPSQAALAKIRDSTPPVAERFEVYFHQVELANGYHELCDPLEQKKRFDADNQRRQQLELPNIPIDISLLAALSQGLPTCAGVALGIDRLIMLALNAQTIGDVSF